MFYRAEHLDVTRSSITAFGNEGLQQDLNSNDASTPRATPEPKNKKRIQNTADTFTSSPSNIRAWAPSLKQKTTIDRFAGDCPPSPSHLQVIQMKP